MIEIKNLNKTFGDSRNGKKVLDGLNSVIQSNCMYGLIGANGAGKSTLLRIINDVYQKDSGSVLIDGEEVANNERVKQKLAFLPDDMYLIPGYTLLDMASYYNAMYDNFDMEYLKQLASNLKLDLNAKLDTFSKGMKRQCMLICILATNAEYMFFDETFDGLDPVVRNYMKKILSKHMSEKNATIVMTSHNLRELEDICDNLGVLYKGGILFESDIDTLKTQMFKVQIALKEDFSEETFRYLNPLSYKKTGSIATLIFRNDREKIEKALREMNPVVFDFLGLTLEEIFIYEMEGIGYEYNEIFQ